jgi:putative transposase
MPNRPSDPDTGLALALARAHRLYAGFVNARARQTGHLFQGRFGSVAMDEDHLMAAARTVALNPVRARLVGRA